MCTLGNKKEHISREEAPNTFWGSRKTLYYKVVVVVDDDDDDEEEDDHDQPRTLDHTLYKLAQVKLMSTCHTSHLIRKLTGKMLPTRVSTLIKHRPLQVRSYCKNPSVWTDYLGNNGLPFTS